MQLTKKFDTVALVSALKPIGIADGLQDALDFVGVLFGWIIASLAIMAASNPVVGLVAGFVPQLISLIEAHLPGVGGASLKINVVTVKISKAWDPKALTDALKKAELPDVLKTINDAIAVLFDWINSSIALNASPVEASLMGILTSVEQMALKELAVLEAKVIPQAAPVAAPAQS